jgi:16S rRNA (uracil1498-N3)-methyltransferase
MLPRLFVDQPLAAAVDLALPARAARHAQVLRLQPGAAVTLFDGSGGEWSAQITAMDRRDVRVQVLEHRAHERELPIAVTLALAMPANDRMDALVEKATELGVAGLQPLLTERSVLRLAGERAERRQAHWQAIAVAACEQSGRNRVPTIHPVRPLAAWLAALPPAGDSEVRLLLGWRDASPWSLASARVGAALTLLSGPEGGLTDSEEALARTCDFVSTSLGPRILRADTAPLAALAAVVLSAQ